VPRLAVTVRHAFVARRDVRQEGVRRCGAIVQRPNVAARRRSVIAGLAAPPVWPEDPAAQQPLGKNLCVDTLTLGKNERMRFVDAFRQAP
jgi:hypothetical protein